MVQSVCKDGVRCEHYVLLDIQISNYVLVSQKKIKKWKCIDFSSRMGSCKGSGSGVCLKLLQITVMNAYMIW